MLKSKTLLAIIYGVLFFILILIFILSRFQKGSDTLITEYPTEPLQFAGEQVPIGGRNFDTRERFDKEFIITSNNLYQLYLYIKRYPLYIPYIEERLSEANIPNDFKYLPIAESALKSDVVSTAGAAGIWQFMPETAKRYNLRVDDQIDERYHFEKSTEAAIKYLSDLYEKFGDWTLVAAAYNRGENGLQRDITSQGQDSYYNLYLNNETSRYVFRILAIKYVMQDYFQKKDTVDTLIGGVYSLPDTKQIQVDKIDNIQEWAQENNYNYRDVRLLNPWIVGDSLPEGTEPWDILVLQ